MEMNKLKGHLGCFSDCAVQNASAVDTSEIIVYVHRLLGRSKSCAPYFHIKGNGQPWTSLGNTATCTLLMTPQILHPWVLIYCKSHVKPHQKRSAGCHRRPLFAWLHANTSFLRSICTHFWDVFAVAHTAKYQLCHGHRTRKSCT